MKEGAGDGVDGDYTASLTAVPVGVEGEIYVGGPTLARGYLERPDLNRKKFPPRPAPSALTLTQLGKASGRDTEQQYARLYACGDWGRLLPNGDLEIVGRHDSMQKIRGYSVELRAVEQQLQLFEGVHAVAVLAVGAEGTDKQIAAFVVLSKVSYP